MAVFNLEDNYTSEKSWQNCDDWYKNLAYCTACIQTLQLKNYYCGGYDSYSLVLLLVLLYDVATRWYVSEDMHNRIS